MALGAAQGSTNWRKRFGNVQAFIVENYLPIAFAVALTWALVWPDPGRFLVNIVVAGNVHIVQELNMALVFLLSGLALNTRELRTALRRDSWPAVAYGAAMILVVSPALGFATSRLPLSPPAFAIGLTIFCLVPTTLGIGVALVRSCRGNEAVALLLTVATNMAGVATLPPYLRMVLGGEHHSGGGGGEELHLRVDVPDLLFKLTLTILVPSLLGKALRESSPAVASFATRHRTSLSLLSTTNLAFIVWQTLSGAQHLLLRQTPGSVGAVVLLAAGVHLAYLAVNHLVLRLLFRPPPREHVAVVVMASQKSAPVAVTVISYVAASAAQQGLLAIPCVVGQLCQIFIGAALAKYVSHKVEAAAAAAAAEAAGAAAAARGDVEAQREGVAAAAAAAAAAQPPQPEESLRQPLLQPEEAEVQGAAGGASDGLE